MLFFSSTLLVLSGYTTGTACDYCVKDFVHVGKHVWRCRQRLQPIDNPTIHHDTRPPEANSATLPFVQIQSFEDPTRSLVSQDESELETVNNLNNLDNDDDSYLKEYYCGKKCKGLKGLRAYQRSSNVLDLLELRSLFQQPFIDEFIEREIESAEAIEEQIIDNSDLPDSEPLRGLKLPKLKDEWENVNTYFRNNLIMPENIHDIDETAKEFQKTIYEFFVENYGTHDNTEKGELITKYADHSKNQLRKALRQLKQDPSSEWPDRINVCKQAA